MEQEVFAGTSAKRKNLILEARKNFQGGLPLEVMNQDMVSGFGSLEGSGEEIPSSG